MRSRFDFSAPAIAALAQADAARALQEDVADGDLTASLVDAGRRAHARVLVREPAVLCGAPWVEATLAQLDPQVRIDWRCAEGGRCEPNQVVLEMEGPARALLTAERTALNFLQLLSAVATKAALYSDIVEGTRARIVDTRKTLPGLRLAQKYAVRVGGGMNQRLALYDGILIKENHIAAAGGVAAKPESEIVGTGYCVASLEAALWCFHHTDSFEDAILQAANLGDDADTTAAIVGRWPWSRK